MKPSVGWALVGAQFGLIAGLIVLPAGNLWPRGGVSVALAVVLIVAGLVVVGLAGRRLGPALTPLPIPKDGAKLVTGGVYRYVRHPMYTGVLLAALGLMVLGASGGHLVGVIALFAVLSAKASGEEEMLAELHPGYGAYRTTSGRLIPKIFSRN